jgi:carbon starvation protein CstA
MKQRNIVTVFLLTVVTFSIYGYVWLVKTKNEMVALGAEIPTAWLLIVPFANIWWYWKYSEGVEKVTAGKLSGVLSFIMLLLLGIIGFMVIQSVFNGLSATNSNVEAQANPTETDNSTPPAAVPPAAVPPAA